MKIYIDNDYKCHVSPGEGLREFDVPFFDGKCDEFIEGYRYIPDGETWTNENGVKCSGTSPWKDYNELRKAQAEYEHGLLIDLQTNSVAISDADTAYQEGVNGTYG